MSKQIIGLTENPLSIRLADRACSLFINPESGLIFLDEGAGEDRMSGAVCDPARGPRFAPQADGGLVLNYGRLSWSLGRSDRPDAVRAWAEAANAFLASKQPLDIPEPAAPKAAGAEPALREAVG